MSGATYFVRECPTCGRNLQVRVEYLGRRVVCQHCAASFLAVDPTSSNIAAESVLARAEQLIESVELSGIGLGASRTAS